jgi:hypothetical protein
MLDTYEQWVGISPAPQFHPKRPTLVVNATTNIKSFAVFLLVQ